MALSSPFRRSALATVLSLVAAATIVAFQPAAAAAPTADLTMAEKVVNTALRP